MKKNNKVTAVVLAGGFGTRLSPLTDTKPKPLVKILDTSVLDSILSTVGKSKVSKTVVSTHYKSEKIMELCREKYPAVYLKNENVPLGTAGGVRFCTDAEDETVLVVSGDAVFDFPLDEILDFHFENKCDVTLVCARKENPTSYGVVITDDGNNVKSFCEKPSWKNVKSDLVNTGIYVLDKKIIGLIPDNIRYDFSQNLFPRLLREGYIVKAYVTDGYWCDVGSLGEYFACNAYAVQNKLLCVPNSGMSVLSLAQNGVHSDESVYASPGAVFGKNVRLSSSSVVCAGAEICSNCDVSMSVIGAKSRIGEGSSISGAIIGEECSIGENCIIPEGCVLGDGCRICDGAVLEKHERIKPSSVVYGKENVRVLFSRYENIFVDDGVCRVDLPEDINMLCSFATALCAALCGGGAKSSRIAVMSTSAGVGVKKLLLSSLAMRGIAAFDCGSGNSAVCALVTQRLCATVGVLLEIQNEKLKITLYNSDGRLIDENTERKICKALSSPDNDLYQKKEQCEAAAVPSLEIYTSVLCGFVSRVMSGKAPDRIKIGIDSKGDGENISSASLERVLMSFGVTLSDNTQKALVFTLSNDGKRASVKYNNTILDHEHICAVILKNRELLGVEGIFPGENSPCVLRSMAKITSDCNSGTCENFICRDGCLACLAFICVLNLRAESFEEICREIPPFEIYTDEYMADINRGQTMQILSRMYHDKRVDNGAGISLCLADGNVTVIPNRAKGFKIISEAVSMEAARELSLKIGDIIKGKK